MLMAVLQARINARDEHFLVNPFGLLYDEVTASNLVRVDLSGAVLDPGSSAAGINLAGYVLHSAIHESRPDVMCALHVHLPDAIAVSGAHSRASAARRVAAAYQRSVRRYRERRQGRREGGRKRERGMEREIVRESE